MPENPASTSTASETAKRGQTERSLDFRLLGADCRLRLRLSAQKREPERVGGGQCADEQQDIGLIRHAPREHQPQQGKQDQPPRREAAGDQAEGPDRAGEHVKVAAMSGTEKREGVPAEAERQPAKPRGQRVQPLRAQIVDRAERQHQSIQNIGQLMRIKRVRQQPVERMRRKKAADQQILKVRRPPRPCEERHRIRRDQSGVFGQHRGEHQKNGDGKQRDTQPRGPRDFEAQGRRAIMGTGLYSGAGCGDGIGCFGGGLPCPAQSISPLMSSSSSSTSPV